MNRQHKSIKYRVVVAEAQTEAGRRRAAKAKMAAAAEALVGRTGPLEPARSKLDLQLKIPDLRPDLDHQRNW